MTAKALGVTFIKCLFKVSCKGLFAAEDRNATKLLEILQSCTRHVHEGFSQSPSHLHVTAMTDFDFGNSWA